MSHWNRFLELGSRDRVRLVGYTLSLPFIALALKGVGYRKVYAFLSTYPRVHGQSSAPTSEVLQESKRIASLVSIAARHGLYRATCLHQSLLVWWLLRRRGLNSEIRIGIQKKDQQIYAHAWVRLGDEVISEGTLVEKNFTAFEGMDIE